MKKKKQGFTLIELIVVIAVLVILVTIGIPRFLGQTEEANLTKLRHDARIVQDASDRYYIDNNEWPYLFDEDGNKLIVSNPKELKIIYKVEDYNESNLGTNPENDIVLYEIDFDKLKPYIRKLNSDTAYFVAAQGNPEFGITALDSKSNKDRVTTPIKPKLPDGAIREPGDGEIVITTAEDLAKIGKDKNYPLNGKYIQMSDIDLSGYENWVPIGSNTNNFTGSFDGNGFKIRNLYINRPDTGYQGLFGYTNGATLTNISLEDIDITGGRFTGGLVGEAYTSNKITNSYATGTVTGTGDRTGGLVGRVYNSSVTNSYATGSVTGTGGNIGGLVGRANNSSIENSYATGYVEGKDDVGGLIGYANNTTVSNSYSQSSVTCTGVLETNAEDAGGLIGYAVNSKISNSYSTGLVKVSRKDFWGGFTGRSESTTISNSYWNKETSGQTKSTGRGTSASGKTTEQMKQQSTYQNWDFDNIWQIIEGQSYPYLRDNPQTPPPGTN